MTKKINSPLPSLEEIEKKFNSPEEPQPEEPQPEEPQPEEPQPEKPEEINLSKIVLTEEEKNNILLLTSMIQFHDEQLKRLKLIVISIGIGSLVLIIVLYFIVKPKK